jgi:hypothetical protein
VRLAGLQLVDQLLAPLLPRFLGVRGQEQPLDDHAALQSEVLPYKVPHGPGVHLMKPYQLPNAPLQICSDGAPDPGDGGDSPDGLLTSASWPLREVLPVILQLFDLENQAPTDPQFAANMAVVLAHAELFRDKLAAGVIHGD